MFVERFIESWRAKEGSWAIANPSYLKVLEDNSKDMKGFVDFGAGIGTVSAFLKSLRPELLVIGIEPDSWCRSAFRANTIDFAELVLTDSLRTTEITALVGFSWSIDMAFQVNDAKTIAASAPKELFIEGHRFKQRYELAREFLRAGHGFSYSSFRGNGRRQKGGCRFILTNSPGLPERIVLSTLFVQFLCLRSWHVLVNLTPKTLRMRTRDLISKIERIRNRRL